MGPLRPSLAVDIIQHARGRLPKLTWHTCTCIGGALEKRRQACEVEGWLHVRQCWAGSVAVVWHVCRRTVSYAYVE